MPTRNSLQIKLPLKDRRWIEAQVAGKRFESIDAAVGYLVRSARALQTRSALEQALVAGIKSGPARPLTSKLVRDLRSRVVKRVARAREHDAINRQKSA